MLSIMSHNSNKGEGALPSIRLHDKLTPQNPSPKGNENDLCSPPLNNEWILQ